MNQFIDNNSENILSGNLITEDFLDNVDGSTIVSAAGEDGSLIPDDGPRMQVTINVVSILSFSLKKRAQIIERILNQSPLITSAQVAACNIEDNLHEIETVEFVRSEIPDDRRYLNDVFLKGKFRPTSSKITVNFDVAISVVRNISYQRFAKCIFQLDEKFGRYVNYHPDDATMFVIYDTHDPEDYGQFICTNGYYDEDDIKDAYRILYGKTPEHETSVMKEYAAKTDFMTKIHADIDAYNKTDGAYTIVIGDLKALDEDHIVIPAEFYAKNITDQLQKRTNYFFMLIEKHIMRNIPKVVLEKLYVGVSLRADVKIDNINNKTDRPLRDVDEEPSSENESAINIAFRFNPVVLTKKNLRWETFRFANIIRMRDNTRIYVIVPLTNGYIASNPDELDSANKNFLPFIKEKL